MRFLPRAKAVKRLDYPRKRVSLGVAGVHRTPPGTGRTTANLRRFSRCRLSRPSFRQSRRPRRPRPAPPGHVMSLWPHKKSRGDPRIIAASWSPAAARSRGTRLTRSSPSSTYPSIHCIPQHLHAIIRVPSLAPRAIFPLGSFRNKIRKRGSPRHTPLSLQSRRRACRHPGRRQGQMDR